MNIEQKIKELKAKPILFKTDMVRAILEDRKTETRRIIKPQYQHSNGEIWTSIKKNNWMHQGKIDNCESLLKVCPYGKTGEYLWVRETWCNDPHENVTYLYREQEKYPEYYKWKPSIYMPKSACRLIIKIEDLGIERIQDITEESAVNEGITLPNYAEEAIKDVKYPDPSWIFKDLWIKINGQKSWDINYWVWRIKFSKYI
jgi:hypothetical protein